MADNEIIKALECCNSIDSKHCKPCPLFTDTLCNVTLRNKSLDLINRQQAEIERLKNKCEDCAGCSEWRCDCSNIRNHAIEEFAERVKQEINFPLAVWRVFDNLVKEMTEGGVDNA